MASTGLLGFRRSPGATTIPRGVERRTLALAGTEHRDGRGTLFPVDDDRRTRLPFKVIQAQAGDRGALEWILREVQPELLGYLTRYLGDAAEAEDVVQDTFMIICRQVRWLREARFYRTWVYRIATREAWRRLRRRTRHEPLADDHEAVDATWMPEETARLVDKVESLPPNCRAVILLHYWSGLNLAAVAAALDIPLGTVKSRLAYALQLLRKDVAHEP